MKSFLQLSARGLFSLLCSSATALNLGVQAQGIPEPGLTFYGTVTNTRGGANVPLRSGRLRWTIKPPTGQDAAITVETDLQIINDQFSYVLRVPFETVFPGFSLSPNALRLNSAQTTYDRVTVTIDGQSASLVPPSTSTFTFSALDRGRIQRVDLTVSIAQPDTDGNGLFDYWEQQYFGRLGVDPLADPDGDGLSNSAEQEAGTDPTDRQSQFRLVTPSDDPLGGIRVTWSSVPGRLYHVERSPRVTEGFTRVTPTAGILGAAGSDRTSWRDATATGSGSYFYRMVVVYTP